MIDIRRLAALDIAFLGPRVILIEFSVGAVGSLALGALTLARSGSRGGALFGLYLISIGINYVPLVLYAVAIVRTGSAAAEIAGESGGRARLFRRYRRQSLLLLLPLVVPFASAIQEWRRRQSDRP